MLRKAAFIIRNCKTLRNLNAIKVLWVYTTFTILVLVWSVVSLHRNHTLKELKINTDNVRNDTLLSNTELYRMLSHLVSRKKIDPFTFLWKLIHSTISSNNCNYINVSREIT